MRETYTDTSGAAFIECDTSDVWPDWEGIESCECGAELVEDGDTCECGIEYWTLVAPHCADCDAPISGTYFTCLDGGEDYCTWCYAKIKRQDVRYRRAVRRGHIERLADIFHGTTPRSRATVRDSNTGECWTIHAQPTGRYTVRYRSGKTYRDSSTERGAYYAIARNAGDDANLTLDTY